MELRFGESAHVLLRHLPQIQPKAGPDQPDQRFDQADLVQLAQREETPTDLKAAALYFANNPEQFTALETRAGIGPADGYAGRLDLQAAGSDRLDYNQAVDILAVHAGNVSNASGNNPGRIGRDDLATVLGDTNFPAELGEAAYFFLSRPHEFTSLGNASRQGMPDDGYVGPADIRASQLGAYYADKPMY